MNRGRNRRLGSSAAVTAVLLVTGGLTACAAPSSTTTGTARPSVPATSSAPTPSTTPGSGSTPTTANTTELCEANRESAAAKAGTVAEDLAATHRQADAIAAMLPMSGVSDEVAAGAEVFADATQELIGILQEFPPDAIVADIGLDPRFLDSQALAAAATNTDYQAFIGWAIVECTGVTVDE